MPDALQHLIDRLPHGEAFRFVSQVRACVPGESAWGVWRVEPTDPRLAGHFPGRPVVPGVLIAEALGQLAGLAAYADDEGAEDVDGATAAGMLAHVDVRFKRPVEPPADIELRAAVTRQLGALVQFNVEAQCDGVVVARGSLAVGRAAERAGD